MELSVTEVATLLGRSKRTIRARLLRGELKGVKKNGQWRITRQHLPLTEDQRATLQAKAESIRQTVEGVLPSRLAQTAGQRSKSLVDLDAFRHGAGLLGDIREEGPNALDPQTLERVDRGLERALIALSEAAQQFDRRLKIEALQRSRADLAAVLAVLLLATRLTPEVPVASWISRLEQEVLPALAGFARWADRLRSASA